MSAAARTLEPSSRQAPPGERVQKRLAAAGHGSRRQIEEWIRAGRITIDGRVVELGERVAEDADIRLDGRALVTGARDATHEVLLYHKPAGEVTTRADPQGRPTVFQRLPPPRSGRWVVVGRLDVNTTGLLLFTNDGELAHALMHPSSQLEREYLVRVRGAPTAAMLASLRTGVTLADGPARFERLEPAASQQGREGAKDRSHQWFRVVLREGRNREVRRLWQAVGMDVSRLIRLRYGRIGLPEELRCGQWRWATANELRALAQAVRGRRAARRTLGATLAVACALLIPVVFSPARTADGPASEAATPDVERVSSSFEVKHADAVLRQVAKLFSAGFVRRDADLVAREIQALPADQTRLWVFNALRKGATYPLQVRARLDQSGMLELDFFTVPSLAAEVRGTLDRYRKASGL